jgi:hypothetical protein
LARGPPDALQGLIKRFSRDQPEIELVGFQHRNVLAAAFGIARLYRQCRICFRDRRRKGVSIGRKAAALGGCAEADRGLLRCLLICLLICLAAILRRRAGRQQHAGQNHISDVHGGSSKIGAAPVNFSGIARR